ncbi:MAG: SufS family cysteine desulfurase [Candidatus Gracilibacteria bacterium]|jgi:cysteine desulfurase/selenocysteine lyase
MLDPKKIKKQFPIFKRKINGKTIVYLDNAATTQKPQSVIDSIKDFYENRCATVHRGIYSLSEEATAMYEAVRQQTAKFINAKSDKEIIFTKNSTEAANLVAYSFGEKFIKPGDEIIVSIIEHHANFIPWQQVARKKQAKLLVIPMKNPDKKDYSLDMTVYKKMLSKKTKLVAISAMSNVLGTLIPVKEIAKEAHKIGAKVLVDAAQSAPHIKTDVQDMDCDFLIFSAHKMLGPTGVGILYGKEEILNTMPPFLVGGQMIKNVSVKETLFGDLPYKFEAGTPNVADVIAFGKALEFLEKIGFKAIQEHEKSLLKEAYKVFSKYDKIKIYLPENLENLGGILSFSIQGVHPHDIAEIFNTENVFIRAGQHCAHPLLRALKVDSTARISFYIYNEKEDIYRAEKALKQVLKLFAD